MNASDALSRRVLIARLWLIQDAVAQGRVADALRHYDIALRTSDEARPLLFPALGRALADDRLVPAISALLQARPAWAGAFLYTTIVKGVASDNLALTIERLHPVPNVPGADLAGLLIAQLVAEGHFAVARRLASPRLPRATHSLAIDGDFSDARGDPPFNWSLADTSTLTAERIGDRSGLMIRADQDAGGDAAAQVLMLPPGAYALSSRGTGPVRVADPPLWTVRCVGSDVPLATLPMAEPSPAEALFSVPINCPVQWLRLAVRPGGAQVVTIDSVDVRRIGTEPSQ